MAGGLLGGGRNTLGGSIMNMLGSAKGNSLLPLLQLMGGGKTPQLGELMKLLSALPKPAPSPPPADAEQEDAEAATGGTAGLGALSQLLADPQLLSSLASLLAAAPAAAAAAATAPEAETEAEDGEMTEYGYEVEEEEPYAAQDMCFDCRAACPRALQLFPSYEQVLAMSRAFPRY